MFEQAGIAVQDEKVYSQMHVLIDAAFDLRDVEVLLTKVSKAKLRIRDFETVLKRGYLGKEAPALYVALSVSDQGLTRERYLRLVEAVALELRQRYFQGLRVLLRNGSEQVTVDILNLPGKSKMRTQARETEH